MFETNLLAYAKINWMLDIIGQRPDGYHELAMIMQQVSLADELIIKESKEDSFICPEIDVPAEKNLAFRAWQLLKKKSGTDISLAIELKKNIPSAAGLGGGSADAAAILGGLNSLLNLNISEKELAEIALSLGADVPFCLMGGLAKVGGVGEILAPLQSCKYDIVIANPGFPLSTADIFRLYDTYPQSEERIDINALAEALSLGDRNKVAVLMENRLQSIVLKHYPKINILIEAMCELDLRPMMSGSGPSFFAIAENEEHAAHCAAILRSKGFFAAECYTK